MKKAKLLQLPTGTVLMAMWSGAALAQTVAPAKTTLAQNTAPTKPNQAVISNHVEDIIVTAQRKSTRLQETPVAVTALNAKALKDKGINNLLDVGNVTPGLEVNTRSTEGAAGGGFTIRGIGVDASDSSPAVGIYVDDVYYPSGVGNLLGIFDVGQIEVLRGPQGTLFGRNTIAGAVLYNSNRPSPRLGGFLDVTIGNQGQRIYGGALNIPINDTIAMRFSGQSDDMGGYVKDLLHGTMRGADSTKQGRVQLRWKPTTDLTIDLKGEMVDEQTNGRAVEVGGINPYAQFPFIASGALGPFGPPVGAGEHQMLNSSYITTTPYTFPGFNSPDFFKINYQEIEGILGYNINDLFNVKLISSYSYTKSDEFGDLDNTPLSIISAGYGERDTGLFTQEGRVAGKSPGGLFEWTLGAYYYDSRLNYGGFGTSFGFGPPQVSNGASLQKTQSVAGYGQLSIHITKRLSADLGLRYSHEIQTAAHLTPAFLPFPPFAVLYPARQVSFNDLSPLFGLNFKLTPSIFLYAKASKGFRAGGFTVDNTLPGGYSAFAPETAWTYEVGARSEFFNKMLRFNPTLYLTNWKEIQFDYLDTAVSTVAPITENAGTAKIKGFELEAQLAPAEGLLFSATGTWEGGRYTTVNPAAGVTLGDPLQHLPDVKFSLGAQYTREVTADASLTGSVNYSYTDGQRGAVSNSDFVNLPAYGLVNLRLQLDTFGDRIAIAGFANNLTDKHYLIGGASGLPTFGTTEFDVARPRQFGIELTAKY